MCSTPCSAWPDSRRMNLPPCSTGWKNTSVFSLRRRTFRGSCCEDYGSCAVLEDSYLRLRYEVIHQ